MAQPTRHLSMSDSTQLLDERRQGRMIIMSWRRQASRDSKAHKALADLDEAILAAADAVSGVEGFLRDRLDKAG